ncbi:MAG: hypothetical protein FWE05_00785 [Defluviitaleaceae bacterium]|nr:hypothetical protein [Defluviitaleaceae bacterium]
MSDNNENRRTLVIPSENMNIEARIEPVNAKIEKLTQNKTKRVYEIYDSDEYFSKYKPSLSMIERSREFENVALMTMIGLEDRKEEWLGTPEQWELIDKEFPNTTRVLAFNGEIVGYYFYLFIKEEYFSELKKGNLTDSNITIDMVDISGIKGKYLCYFVDIAIVQKHRWVGASLLLEDFAKQLENYAKNEIYVSEVCTIGFTQSGEDMCVRLGLDNVSKNIYSLKLIPFPQSLVKKYPKSKKVKTLEKLKKLYDENNYNE